MSTTQIWHGYLQAWKDHGLFLGLLIGIIALALMVVLVLA